MCMKSPKPPAPPPPPPPPPVPPQEADPAQQAARDDEKKRVRRAIGQNGTILTGAQGDLAAPTVGSKTLLGG